MEQLIAHIKDLELMDIINAIVLIVLLYIGLHVYDFTRRNWWK